MKVKKLLIRTLSVMLAVVLTLTVAPLSEFFGVDHNHNLLDTSIEAKAATKSEIQAELLRRLYNGAGGRITCDFDGYVSTPGRHEGIDCALGSGKTVYAIADGVVTYTGGSYGMVVIYNSTYNVTIIYMHTKGIKVSTGATVTTGQAIALESNTAPTSMGVHTHVELRTGRRTGAAKSTNDATLDNPNPYPYYEQIFSGTIVHSPIGALDSASAESGKVSVSGWAFDKDDINAQLDIHVYIGGPAGSSSAEGHSGIKANTSRADVNDVYGCGNNHGYSATINTSKTGSQTVYVYAINVGGGSNTLIGSKTVNISGASVTLTNNTSYSSLLPIKAYLKGTSKVYPYNRDCSTLTGGEIWSTDECTITAIYTNGWCEVVYPTSSGNKTAYTQLSNFMGTSLTQKTAGIKSTTYSRADASTSIGSVSAGDVCYVTTTSGSYSQAIYPTSSGNKLGWVLSSALNYTAPSTDARFSPYTPIKGYILSGDTRQNVYESDHTTYAGQLFVDDYCTIDAVYSDGWCLVTYPAGSTTKQKYAPLGAFVHDTGCTPEKYVSNAQIQVFPKADMKATVTWYISSGDTFFVLSRTPAVAGQIAQVLYPIDAQYGGGYKIGWIYQNQIPSYTYTVSYNANGGSGAPASQTKQYNVDLALSSTKPTKSGYTFAGWSTSSSAISVNYAAGATYTNNAAVTLYAVWTPNKYTITYNANGGSGAPATQTKTHGVNLTLSSSKPVKSYQVNFDACGGYVDTESKYVNYTFIGWSTSSSATSATYSAGANFTLNANTTLYAVWSIPQVGTLPLSSREGYIFKGWYTAKTGGTKVEASTVLTGSSTTLYAQWTAETYTISYDANGGSGAPSSQTKTYGQTITLSTTKPTRSGCTFLGWSTDSTATSPTYSAGESFTENVDTILYAVWHTHSYTSSVTTAATCTATGVRTYKCSSCSHSYTETIPAAGHKWTAATCSTPKTCSVCKITEGSPNSHSYTSKVTKEPTCTATGVRTYTCSKCSHSYTESIAATGHSFGSWTTTTVATCTVAGKQTRTCSKCSKTETKDIAALGHNYSTSYTVDKEATCTEAGSKSQHCSRCSSTKNATSIPATGHSYTSKVTKEPTCTATGVRTYTCSKCSHSYTESIAATGHSFGSWTTKTAATCTTVGKQTRTCSKCSTTETKDIAALGHNYSTSYTTDKAATCTTAGSKSQHCTRCTAKQNVTAIPATGHKYVNGVCSYCKQPNPNPVSATVTMSSASATAGNQVKVSVSLKNNPGITSMLLKVSYDTTKLQLVSVEDCGNLGSAYHSNSLNSPFTLSWANDTATTNYTHNGDIAVFTFKIKDGAALGSTPITITYDYDNYDIIDKDMNPVEFNVVSGSVNVIDVIIGDVNNDGKVNQLDRVVLTRYLANWTEYPEGSINTVAADVNCDGKVNTLDRVILTRFIANWTGYESLPYNN
ncbi:MAG: InlB B-repeat-containing protein [Clostridia bacterium]|nr:InlB B-repeat-containing protein [Clostridia bacterium]